MENSKTAHSALKGAFKWMKAMAFGAALLPLSTFASVTLVVTDPWSGAVRPLAGARIMIYDGVGSHLWTSPVTDGSGVVSLSGVVPQKLGYGAIGFMVVSAENAAIKIIQKDDCLDEALAYVIGHNKSIYPGFVRTQGSNLDNRTLNVGDGYIPLILEMGTLARQTAIDKFGYTPPRLDVFWDPCLYYGDGWAHFTGLGGNLLHDFGGAFAGTNMTLLKKYMTNREDMRETVAHEYGHYLHFMLAGQNTLPGGGSHTLFSKGNAGLAYTEGWAEFFAEYVLARNVSSFPWWRPTFEGFPQTYNNIRGTDQEAHVASFFWDLLDGDVPNAGDETFAGTWTQVRHIMARNCRNMNEFLDWWKVSFPEDKDGQNLAARTFYYGFPGHEAPKPARRQVAIRGKRENGAYTIKPFYIGAHEVSQGDYHTVRGEFPFKFTEGGNWARPAESVTYLDAILYCNALSAREGLKQVYTYSSAIYQGSQCIHLEGLVADLKANGYRLPTKEEWTWAYQAGTTGTFYWGSAVAGNYAWYRDNSGGTTHPMGGKLPNAWGVYDIAGNVREWVWNGWPSVSLSAMGGGYNDFSSTSNCNLSTGINCATDNWGFRDRGVGFRTVRNRYDITPVLSLLLE